MPDGRLLHRARSLLLPAALMISSCKGREDADPKEPEHSPALPSESANEVTATPSVDAQKQELLALERAYSNALIRRDRDFLEAYYAPDWRGGNWLGFWTKATMLKAVLNARYEIRSMRLQNVEARVVGRLGIVQGVSNEVTRVDGRDTSGRWTFTDVFERRNGRWVAIASHTSELTGQTD